MTGTRGLDQPDDRPHPLILALTSGGLVVPPMLTPPASAAWTWNITVIIIFTAIILGARL